MYVTLLNVSPGTRGFAGLSADTWINQPGKANRDIAKPCVESVEKLRKCPATKFTRLLVDLIVSKHRIQQLTMDKKPDFL